MIGLTKRTRLEFNMADRRELAANGRVAHMSLQGKVKADRFVIGEWASVISPLADILDAPAGRRERQAVYGERFEVLERRGGFAFGRAGRDGYVGYVADISLGPDMLPTHWVAAPATHLYSAPDIKQPEVAALTMGARLAVVADVDARFVKTNTGHFALRRHLRAMGDWAHDAVDVAMGFLGTPYLWGGNSRSGLDCSGLVQASHLACGISCPGDSDQQQAKLGSELAATAVLARGDLLFWGGHVAMCVDGRTLIHAAGHFMAVVTEDIDPCIARILSETGELVTMRRRL